MTDPRPRLIGMNHIALEVGDIDEALEFWGKIFRFELQNRSDTMAFIDMGDQFIALMKSDTPHRDEHRQSGEMLKVPCDHHDFAFLVSRHNASR